MTVRRWFLVALVAVGGAALRVWVYRSALGRPDSDEAIVGLMARHALHGQFTTFYWGQPYGGPQEAWLTAPVFAVGGTSLLTLRVVTVVLTLVAVWLVWLVGRRLLGDRGGALAAGLFWLWPPFDVMWLVHERGFYASDVVYCLLLLLLALRVVDLPSRARVAAFGFVLGLGFWQTAQIVPIALPLIAWTPWRAPAALRSWWAGIVGVVIGALPWLVWNVRHDWASLLPHANGQQYAHSLRLFASPLLPMLLGLRAPLTGEALLPKVLLYAAYGGLLLLFVLGAHRARRRDAFVLYLVAACFPFIWAVARRVTSESSAPLYLVVVSPVVVLLIAQLGRRWSVLALLAACAVSVVTLQRMHTWLVHDPDQFPVPTARDLSPLVNALDHAHVDRVFTDYWLAYRLDFDTDERIVAINEGSAADVRWAPYLRKVASSRHGYVYLRSDSVAAPVGYRRRYVGPYVIFLPSH